MICKKCGNETPDGFVFCRVCGAKLDYSQKKTSYAPNKKNNLFLIPIFVVIICLSVFAVTYLKKSFDSSNETKKLTESIKAASFEESVETKSNDFLFATESDATEIDEILKEVDEIKIEMGTRTFQDITNAGTLVKGKKVKFGSYIQEGDKGTKKTPITWRVLKVKDGEALLLSDVGLDCKEYSRITGNAWWGKATLRTWLNEDFYNAAFTQEEKKCIIKHRVGTAKNKITGVRSGDAVYDYVAIPSEGELDSYLESEKSRRAKASTYAVWRGAFASLEEDYFSNGYYWLRNSGTDHSTAMVVDPHGVPNSLGISVLADNVMVRPEIWVKVD